MFTALRNCHTQNIINPAIGSNTMINGSISTPVWSQISFAGKDLDRSYEGSTKATRLWGDKSE